jgi:hypothetical protein
MGQTAKQVFVIGTLALPGQGGPYSENKRENRWCHRRCRRLQDFREWQCRGLSDQRTHSSYRRKERSQATWATRGDVWHEGSGMFSTSPSAPGQSTRRCGLSRPRQSKWQPEEARTADPQRRMAVLHFQLDKVSHWLIGIHQSLPGI